MIGVAVVGCGYWGPKLIRNLEATAGFRMMAACDPKEGRRAFVARQHPGVELLETPDDLFLRDDVAALWIATPARTHVALARRALESGKHVLVEKPLAMTVADAAGLADLAEERGLVLQTGHTFLFSPAVTMLKRLMSEGAHGRTCYITSERINPGPPRADISVLWDLAVHDVAIICDLLGGEPGSVSARGESYLRRDVCEALFLTLDYPEGVSAHVHVSWMSANKTRVTRVFGTGATLVYDDLAPAPLRLFGAPADNRVRAGDRDVMDLAYGQGEVRDYRPEGPEPLKAECEAFLQAILRGADSPNSARRALSVIRTLEAAETSMKGRALTGPPAGMAVMGAAR